MLPNPMHKFREAEQTTGVPATAMTCHSQSQRGTNLILELRGFKSYLKTRLKYILKVGRSLELRDEVDDIRFYLDVMSDSTADETHGVDGLQGFISKLHEMQYRNPLPDSRELKKLLKEDPSDKDDTASTVSGATADEDDPEEPWSSYNDESVAGAILRRTRNSFEERHILESLRKAEDTENGKCDWWSEVSASFTSNSEQCTKGTEQQPSCTTAHNYNEVAWLREVQPDIISVAGLSDLVERRERNAATMLMDPRNRPIPLQTRPAQQQQTQQPVTAYGAQYSQQSHPNEKPHWFFDQPPPSGEYPSTTSYDCSRNLQNPAPQSVPREPVLTTTYIPGFGRVSITAPLQSVLPPAPAPEPIPFQQYEYQVPREVLPNPCYDAVHQPQPMRPPSHPAYPRKHSSNFVQSRRGRRPPHINASRYFSPLPSASDSTTPTPSTSYQSSYEPDPEPDCDNYDNYDSSSSLCSSVPTTSSKNQYKKNSRFQRQARRPPFPKSSLARNDRFQKGVKRVTINEPEKIKPIVNKKKPETPLSQLRKKLEKERSGMFRLGIKKSEQEMIEPEENVPAQSTTEDDSTSTGSPPPPQENDDDESELELLKQFLMSSRVNKKESTRILKDPEGLKKYYETLKAGISARKQQQVKKGKNVKKTGTPPNKRVRPQPVSKTKEKGLSLQELRLRLVNGFSSGGSSESEAGSIISSVSTRSTARKRNVQSSKPTPANRGQQPSTSTAARDQPAPGKARKSIGKQKQVAPVKPKKKPSPRKRAAARIESSESETEENAVGSSSPEKSTEKKTKLDEEEDERQEEQPEKSRIREAVEAVRNENLQKKQNKKGSSRKPDQVEDLDPMELSLKMFSSSVTKKGNTIVRRNDILVSEGANKIKLGSEYEKIGADCAKKEEKEEMPTVEEDCDNMNPENDEFFQFNHDPLSMVQVQMGCSEGDGGNDTVEQDPLADDDGNSEVINQPQDRSETQEEEQVNHDPGDGQGTVSENPEAPEEEYEEALEEYEDFESDWFRLESVEGNYVAPPREDKENDPNIAQASKEMDTNDEAETVEMRQVKEEVDLMDDDGIPNTRTE